MKRIPKNDLRVEAEQLVIKFGDHAGLDMIGERSLEQSLNVELPRSLSQQSLEFELDDCKESISDTDGFNRPNGAPGGLGAMGGVCAPDTSAVELDRRTSPRSPGEQSQERHGVEEKNSHGSSAEASPDGESEA